MVSIKFLAVAVAALVSVTSASHGHSHHMHRRMINKRVSYGYGYGKNDTVSAPIGTGVPGVPEGPHYTLEPVTYTTASTKYVTVTYTLGNGRAVTKTITKTEEYATTAYETHVAPTVSVVSTIPVEQLPGEQYVSFEPVSDRATSTSTTTLVITVPYGKPTPVAPQDDGLVTLTVTNVVTSTSLVVVTSTIVPVAPVYPTYPPVQHMPPYGNHTVHGDSTSTTTHWTTLTTTIPVPPSGTGGLAYYYK